MNNLVVSNNNQQIEIKNNNSNDKKNAYLILLQAENKHNINNAGILIYKSLGLKNSTSFPKIFLEFSWKKFFSIYFANSQLLWQDLHLLRYLP